MASGGRQAESQAATLSTVEEVEHRLRVYGGQSHHNKEDPLDELVLILLSAQTEEYSYLETYESLRSRFPNWIGLNEATEDEISSQIRHGGLYRKKARQIKRTFQRIVADAGKPTLDFLRPLDDEAVFRYLTSLPGVARKTALCIMMYSLKRPVFPVDTHVWRVARRLGWTRAVPKPNEHQAAELESLIPPEIRYSMHVNMVSHGRETCLTYWPRCKDCVLADLCPSFGKVDITWGDWRKPGGAWARAVGPTDESSTQRLHQSGEIELSR